MAPRYKIGQKVMIIPPKQGLSPRDSDIEPYAGKSGKIVDFYWINVRTGAERFYIYTVQVTQLTLVKRTMVLTSVLSVNGCVCLV